MAAPLPPRFSSRFAPFAALRALLRRRADRWLFRLRDSEPGEVFLNQRRVFIVPTRPGLAFTALLLVLFIGSVNYNLGLGFALTFFAFSCSVVDMVLTSRNLARLHLMPGRAPAVFAGQLAQFELHVVNRSKQDRHAIGIDFLAACVPRHVVDVPAAGSAALRLTVATTARGAMPAPRVRLLTRFPLGLFQAWSYWQPDAAVLVYPFPESPPPPLPLHGAADAYGSGRAGHDDFAGIRPYQAGDPLRHLAWRQIARLGADLGGAMLSKHFDGGARAELRLDFDALPTDLPLETRLSRMAGWVLEAERRALPYGFRLGPLVFPAALGDAHQGACLQALALYGLPKVCA